MAEPGAGPSGGPTGGPDQGPGRGSAGGTDPIAPLTVVRWRSAQDQLFGSLVMAPEGYERAVLLMATVLERLRERVTTLEGLAAAAEGIEGDVAELAQATGHDLGLLAPLVGPASLAVRYDELRMRGASPEPPPCPDPENVG